MTDSRLPSVIVYAGLAAAAVVFLGSCGGGSGGGTTAVELDDFTIDASPGSLSAGDITFDTTNIGELGHELVVARTDLAADALPTDADGAVDETQLDVLGRTSYFETGSETLDLNLDEGNYVFFCNIVDTVAHYRQGMTTSFTVTG